MGTSIFIKTFKNDLGWLKYCIQSIRKFGSGFENIVVVADRSCRGKIPSYSDVLIHFIPDTTNGQVSQQAVKLQADSFTDSEKILFVDSDVVFHTRFTPESFEDETGRPIIFVQKYSEVDQSCVRWKKITEDITGFNIELEYMRRIPLLYYADSLKSIRLCFPDLIESTKSMRRWDQFSEFNLIGAYVYVHENSRYAFLDLATTPWVEFSTQFWSRGGITREIKKTIEGYLEND